METDSGELEKTEQRLDLVRKIKARCGATTAIVNEYADKLREKLDRYREYESYKAGLEEKIKKEDTKIDGRPLYRPTIHTVLPNYTIYYLKNFIYESFRLKHLSE